MSKELLMSDNDMLRNQSTTSLPVTDQNISEFVRLLKDPVLAVRTRSAFKLSSYEKYIPSEATLTIRQHSENIQRVRTIITIFLNQK